MQEYSSPKIIFCHYLQKLNFLGELLKQTFKYRLDELTSVCLVLVSSESFAGACHTAAADLTHQLAY